MVALFIAGEGLPKPALLTVPERTMFLCFTIILVGILMAYRWEGVGGTVILLGFGAFAAVQPRILKGLAFQIFPAIALLFLYLAWKKRRVQRPKPPGSK
jgi:hypothetical protein